MPLKVEDSGKTVTRLDPAYCAKSSARMATFFFMSDEDVVFPGSVDMRRVRKIQEAEHAQPENGDGKHEERADELQAVLGDAREYGKMYREVRVNAIESVSAQDPRSGRKDRRKFAIPAEDEFRALPAEDDGSGGGSDGSGSAGGEAEFPRPEFTAEQELLWRKELAKFSDFR